MEEFFGENDALVDYENLDNPRPTAVGLFDGYPTSHPKFNPALLPSDPDNPGRYRMAYFPYDENMNELPPRWFRFPAGWPGDLRLPTQDQVDALPKYVNRAIYWRIGWKLGWELGYDGEDDEFGGWEDPVTDDMKQRFLLFRQAKMSDCKWQNRMYCFAKFFNVCDMGGLNRNGDERKPPFLTHDELVGIVERFPGFADNSLLTATETHSVLDNLRHTIIDKGIEPKIFLPLLDPEEEAYVRRPFRGFGNVSSTELETLNGTLPNMIGAPQRPTW